MSKILIEDLDHLRRVTARLHEHNRFVAIDVETTGLDLLDSEVIGVALANEGAAWYIDFPSLIATEQAARQQPEERDAESIRCDVWRALLPLLDLYRHILIGHNSKFDLYFIRRELEYYRLPTSGLNPCTNFWDTMQMAVLVNENLIGVQVALPETDGTDRVVGALSLKALSRLYLGRKQRLWDDDFESWPVEERVEYACDDVRNTYDLCVHLAHILRKQGLLDYYQTRMVLQVFVAEAMERHGIQVDVTRLQEAREKVNARIAALEAEIQALVPPTVSYKYGLRAPWTRKMFTQMMEAKQWQAPEYTSTGNPSLSEENLAKLAEKYPTEFDWDAVRVMVETPFNVGSRKQLGEYLVAQGCRLPLTASGQYGTSEENLLAAQEQLPGLPIWGPLFEIQKLEKLRGTYIDGVLEVVWEDGTVHPEWNATGTTSGRYSCTTDKDKSLAHKRGPALQTIPNQERMTEPFWEEIGFNPRAVYIARPGHTLLVGDLSQAEVRFLAVMSGCPMLKQAILTGEDVHAANAQLAWPEEWAKGDAKVRKSLRTWAKQGTFAVTYGAGPDTLAENLHISTAQAEDLLHDFYDAFYGVKDWKQQATVDIIHRGQFCTYGGRPRRPILIQQRPRVTAHPKQDPDRYEQQQLEARVWEACWDVAIRKGKLDPENVTQQQLEGRAVRQCINHAIQGSVGEMINEAAWLLVRRGYRVLLQMHDELIVEVEDNPDAIAAGKEFMEDLLNVEVEGIPFVFEVKVAHSWAEGK